MVENDFLFYRLVNHEECVPIDENSYIYQYYQAEEKEITDFCEQNYISCFIKGDQIVIQTSVDLWKIITYGSKHNMFLYHRNDSRTDYQEDGTSLVPYYHAQKCRKDTIVEYLQYIVAHDDFRYIHPAERPPKWKNSKPRKGTKRYKKALKKQKRIQMYKQEKRVEMLLEQLKDKEN